MRRPFTAETDEPHLPTSKTIGRRCAAFAGTIALAGAVALVAGGGVVSAAPVRKVLAATPYMGWDTSYAIPGGGDEEEVLQQASLLKTSGLEADGYRLVWLDAGWWSGGRNASGQIVVGPASWPHGIAWLAATLHENGFKLGVYTDAGPTGCGIAAGSYGYYQQDVNTLASWGVDAIKVDWCGGVAAGLDPATQYGQIHQAIADNASHRPMLLEICNFLQPGQKAAGVPTFTQSAFFSYSFGPSDGSDSWRTDTDIGKIGSVTFNDVLRNMDADATEPQAAGPGHWNDPGYLSPDQGMSEAQFRTQFSMWAILAAPLMLSRSMLTIDKASLAAVSNRQVIAIDQDPAGIQGSMVPGSASGMGEAWAKPLADGNVAVALLNRGSTPVQVSTSASAVGLPAANSYSVRNLWSGQHSTTAGALSATVAAYSTVLLRVSVR
jgi:alpha-galactosidase